MVKRGSYTSELLVQFKCWPPFILSIAILNVAMFNQVAYEKYLSCVPLLKDDESGKYVCPICRKQYSSLGIKNHIKYHFGWESNLQENARIGRERKKALKEAVQAE